MQLRIGSKRLLLLAVALVLPLHAVAQQDVDLADDPFGPSYDADAVFDDSVKEPDWIPSLRLDLGITHHQGLGIVDTPAIDTDLDGMLECPPNETQNPSRGNNNNHPECPGIRNINGGRIALFGTNRTAVDGATLGFGAELMGPPFENVIGDMRLLVVGGIRDMLEGNTSVVRTQANRLNVNVRIKGKFLIDKTYYAGIGGAFQLPIEGFNVKLKPSINWVKVDSQVTPFLVQGLVVGGKAINNFPRQNEVPITNHGIAPRLELDAEVYRNGPISVGLFGLFEVQYLISGPLKHTETVTSCFGHENDQVESPPGSGTFVPAPCTQIPPHGPNDPPSADNAGVVKFDYDRDPGIYYGGVGLRVSWMGGP